MSLKNFFQMIEHRVAYSARNYHLQNFLQIKQRDVRLDIACWEAISVNDRRMLNNDILKKKTLLLSR